jgi:hypothetical protein
LPDGASYEQGALVISTYLALKQLRWLDEGRVRTERIEVPEQPVRLPFGAGSFIPGSKAALDKQLASFIRAVRRARSGDYENAERSVNARLRVRGAWSAERREKLRRTLLQEEVGHVRSVKLPATDPWVAILPKLSTGLSQVAASGIPAFGTRTRWTLALVKALSELVGPEEARSLMLHWLSARSHASEDISTHFDVAQRHTLRIVTARYKNAGVPKRAWRIATRALDTFFSSRREKDDWWWSYAKHLRHPDLITTKVRPTAFFILKKFYEKGVSTRYINWREFAAFVGKNKARDVERVLASRSWLLYVAPYVREKHSRVYALAWNLWPPRPGEERLYTPW